MRGSLAGLCLLTLATGAEAAEARRRFDIPAKPYADALIDLAVQANISLLGASNCGSSVATTLSGRFSLSDALTRVLAGAPCAWRIVDAQTVRVTAVAPAPRIVGPAAPVMTELLVTAFKRPERLATLPAGVSVISSEQLTAPNAYDVRETAGQLVGVLTTNLGPGRDKLLMRGLSDGAFTGRARSTVSTYLDDAPINYNAPDPDLRLTDVQRVETVRGPQGALYGSGALAGIYRIVTNKPDPERYSGSIQVSGATTIGGSASYETDGYVNIPLAHGAGALRLVAYYDDQGGYIDNGTLRLSNVDSTVRTGGRVALQAALSDRWTLDVLAAGQRLSSRDTQYKAIDQNGRARQVREASNNDFAQLALTLHGDLGWADLATSTSYVRHAYASLYDATSAAVAFSDSGAALGVYSEGARIRRFVQDLVITSSGVGPASWLVGAYGSASVDRTPSSLDILAVGPSTPLGLFGAPFGSAPPPPPPLTRVYNEQRQDHLQELALYGEATWRLSPEWTATAGARAFDTELKVRAAITGAPPTTPRDVAESRSFRGMSSKLSLQREFADGSMLYGLYSEGFRPGGVNTTNFIGVGGRFHPQRVAFEPDRLRNFEFGAKGRFLDKHLTLRAAGFYDLWSNLQSDQYRPSGLAYTANVGDARVTGLEAEAAYSWDMGLTLQANALYSTAGFSHTNPDFASQLGTGLPGAPRLSGGILARYQYPLPHDLTLRLAVQADYVGAARLTFDPAFSARTDPVIDAELLAEIAAKPWSAGLFVTNPADTSGNTFAYGNPFTFGQVRQVTPQRPRTIGVRLGAAF